MVKSRRMVRDMCMCIACDCGLVKFWITEVSVDRRGKMDLRSGDLTKVR